MAQAAKILEEWGYDEVNINCGCPSKATKDGKFGAILMFEPELVATICAEMKKTVKIPVTVKCRLGVDDRDSYPEMVEFVRTVSEVGGITKFIIHARKAFLSGLNPKENRTIPPLKYEWVFKLKSEFPHLNFVINGGFDRVEKVQDILSESQPLKEVCGGLDLEGCMSGRMAMNNPWEIARIDREIYGDLSCETGTREEIIRDYARFA
jgi:tRNA-dihydrouridine synthase A